MTKVYSHKIDNPNLQKALELRQQNIPEARVWLEKACADGDAKALFFKRKALQDGGFFYEKDSFLSLEWLKKAADAGCPMAMLEYGLKKEAVLTKNNLVLACCSVLERNLKLASVHLWKAYEEDDYFLFSYIRDHNFRDVVYNEQFAKKGACVGDVYALIVYPGFCESDKKLQFSLYYRAKKQKHISAYFRLGICYRDGFGTSMNVIKAAKCFAKLEGSYMIMSLIEDHKRSELYFIYGRALTTNENWRTDFDNGFYGSISKQAMKVYMESTQKARESALCFCWIFRGNKYLNKDIVKVIAKDVYKSREEPDIWLK